MIETFIGGIAVRGPGLDGWAAAQPVLAGQQDLLPDGPHLSPPAILSPNERRRAGMVVRLALAVAQEAVEMAALPAGLLRSVFASSNGDGAVVHAILETLMEPDPKVSPTQFHNSVHNAPAGYWSIGAGSRQATTCIGCHDSTAAASVLKAAAEAQVERQPVLLCLYDAPLPEPLGATRPTTSVFGAALVLTPTPSPTSRARLRISYRDAPAPAGRERPRHPGLVALSSGNAAARILRLLEALARNEPDDLSLSLLDGRVDIHVQPCSTDSES